MQYLFQNELNVLNAAMRTDFPALSIFMKVCELGSFAAAATALDISPAAVGQSIKRLEQRFGVRLFNRTTRTMALTPSGELLKTKAKGPLAEIEELDRVFEEDKGIASGLVRISAPLFFSRHYLLPALQVLKKSHPQIEFQIDASDSRRDFVEDPVDLAIRLDKPIDSALIARHLQALSTVNVASQAYLSSHGIPQNIEDLYNHQCIAYRFPASNALYQWQFVRNGIVEAFTPNQSLQFNDAEVCCEAAVLGMGILQTADIIAEPYLKDGRLVKVMDEFTISTKSLYLCYPSRENNPLRLRVCIDFLLQYLGEAF